MRPGYGLFQQQAVKMRMTPQLRQAIKILQLSTPELLEVVRQELEENPILEYAEHGWDSYNMNPSSSGGLGRLDPNHDPLFHAACNDVSLERHLKEQLHFSPEMPPRVRRIIVYMIGNLDTNGYLVPSLTEIAEVLQEESAHVELALKILQSFEPFGVGARDLKECLLLQVRQLPETMPLVPLLIESHLKDIADYRIHKLSTVLQASPHEIQAAVDVIKGLNPRPGALFHTTEVQYVIPDVRIDKAGEQFVVSIHDAAAPRLSVNGYYERMIREGGEQKEAKSFLYKKLHSARFFIKCMEQRRLTLYRVAQAIVEEQTDFFLKGTTYLKPMNLKQIADKLSVHESTVSRATSGKYAYTPWGVFELKYFFPSGLQTDHGELASPERIKAKIKEWVGGENHGKPYSDQKLAELLMGQGIQISRRTVTKYREELGIASSVKRKRV